MQAVLGALTDWLHERLAERPILEWVLVSAIFTLGIWLF
jgi:hypothetical protein